MPFLIRVMGSGQTGLGPKTDLPVQSSPLYCFKKCGCCPGNVCTMWKNLGVPESYEEWWRAWCSHLLSHHQAWNQNLPLANSSLLCLSHFPAVAAYLMASSSCGLGGALRQATWATANPVPTSRAIQVVPEIEKCQSLYRANRLYFVSSLQGEGLGTSRELVCTHVW